MPRSEHYAPEKNTLQFIYKRKFSAYTIWPVTLASIHSALSNGKAEDYKRLSCICLYFQKTHVLLKQALT